MRVFLSFTVKLVVSETLNWLGFSGVFVEPFLPREITSLRVTIGAYESPEAGRRVICGCGSFITERERERERENGKIILVAI